MKQKKKRAASAIRVERIPIYTRLPRAALAALMIAFPALAVPVTVGLRGHEIYFIPAVGQITDLFILFREMTIFVFGIMLLLYFIGERIFPDHPLRAPIISDRYFITLMVLLALYVIMAVVSSVFSAYPYVSFTGSASEHEGLASVTGCVLLFAAAYNYSVGADKHHLLFYTVTGASAVISVLVIAELITGDICALVSGIERQNMGSALLFGNPTVCGEVCALLCTAGLAVSLAESDMKKRLVCAFLAGIMAAETVRSASTAALLTEALSAAAVLLIYAVCSPKNRETPRRMAATAGAAAVSVIIIALISPKQFFSFFQSGAGNSGSYDPSASFGLTDIEASGDELMLAGRDITVSLRVKDGEVSFYRDGEQIAAYEDDRGLTPEDERLFSVHALACDGLLTLDLGYAEPLHFEITNDVIRYIGVNGYLDDITKPAFPELSRFYGFATGRGYIWLSTLPLLKECLIKGFGAGEFVFYFPQNDIVGKLNTHGTAALIIDKPHSMYLQITALYGLPALIAFLAAAALIIRAGVVCIKHGNVTAAGLLICVISYLIMGTVNDCCIVSAVWFWFFAGVLMSFAVKYRAVPA